MAVTIKDIAEYLNLAPSTVSAHLKELKQAGLISERKDGKWVYFGLTDTAKTQSWLTAALANLEGDRQLEYDRQLVEELRRMPVEELCRYGYEAAKSRTAATTAGPTTTAKDLP